MNRQEAFDLIWNGMIKQGKPCVAWIDNLRTCRLKSNGKSCAIGFLIPNDQYKVAMEDDNINAMEILKDLHESPEERQEREELNVFHYTFLEALRECHDDAALPSIHHKGDFLSNFQANMRKLAIEYGLTVPQDLIQ